jgi:hypothetical protein
MWGPFLKISKYFHCFSSWISLIVLSFSDVLMFDWLFQIDNTRIQWKQDIYGRCKKMTFDSMIRLLISIFFWLDKLQLFPCSLILTFLKRIWLGRGWRVPGYLLGYCGSAAACIRIQGLFWNSNLIIEKSSNSYTWVFIWSLPKTFGLNCFRYPSPAFSWSKTDCGRRKPCNLLTSCV